MSEPFGWSGAAGWVVHNAGTAPSADQRVSVHESFHHRLDRSTNYGALLLVLASLANHGDVGSSALRPLRDLCRTVHESAATYLTELTLSPGGPSLDHHGRYRDAMAAVVGEKLGAWSRLHAALAVARASLQPNVLEVVREHGLARTSAATFRSTGRPDDRFRRLRMDPPDFAIVANDAARLAGLPPSHPVVAAAEFDVRWFEPDQRDLWTTFERCMYSAASARLAELGCPTCPSDDNLTTSRGLLLLVRSVYGSDIGLAPSDPDPTIHDLAWIAAAAIDVETPSLPVRRVAVTVGAGLDIDPMSMVAGDGEHAHLHIAIRPIETFATFDWINEPPPGRVALRRSFETPSGRVVEHLDVSALEPDVAIGPVDVRLIATVAESQLTRPDLHSWWHRLRPHAYLLSDLPLIDRVRSWLDGQRVFRYRFLSVQASGAAIPVLVARFEAGEAQHAHLLIRPITSHAVGVLRRVLLEVDTSGTSAREDNGLGGDDSGLGLALFHIVGEDSTFGTRRRDAS